MIQMTFQEYDDYVEKFHKITCKHFWPTPLDLDKMEQDPSKWILLACFLLETNQSPKTNAEKYSKKNLQKFVNANLILID